MASPTVSQLFFKFLFQIAPRDSEVAKAKANLAAIRNRLAKSFHIARATLIGSHVKGTAIRTLSDVDVMIILRREQVRWGTSMISSETLLSNIREDLQERFPLTEVRRDGQAVVVRFASGEHGVDVVPGIFETPASTGHPIYLIPDGMGDWMHTSPDTQLKALNVAHERSGAKLKPVIRMAKAWMLSRSPSIPLNSMHLEAVLIKSGMQRIASYSSILSNMFVFLAGRGGRATRDPSGISGLIPIARTEGQKERVLTALDYAIDHSLCALDAETDGDHAEATRQWKIVFSDAFPG